MSETLYRIIWKDAKGSRHSEWFATRREYRERKNQLSSIGETILRHGPLTFEFKESTDDPA